MLTLNLKKTPGRFIPHLLLTVSAGIAIVCLQSYFIWSSTLFIGLILAPYICTCEKGKFSIRYLIPSLLMLAVAVWIPVRTMLFLSLLFTMLFLIESWIGKISPLSFILFFLISPIFRYLSNLVGFPIRLWLSEIAAGIFTLCGIKSASSGNLIQINGDEFSVDQACAGLNMLAISLVLSLFIISYYQKNQNKVLSFSWHIVILFITLSLNITANLLRIVTLVLFKVLPENPLHDAIGIACLAMYVIIPLLYICKALVSTYAKTYTLPVQSISTPKHMFIHISLFMIVLFVAFNLKSIDGTIVPNRNIRIDGYKQQILPGGILKFENPEALIYLKPTPFYAPEHSPMVCWQGSGYEFKEISKLKVSGSDVYTATLVKGKDRIYSAWWFQNNQLKTINQFKWRWQSAINGHISYLVNANTTDQKSLKYIVSQIHKKTF